MSNHLSELGTSRFSSLMWENIECQSQLKQLPYIFEVSLRLSAGSISGFLGILVTFPLDFSKTRLQKQTTLQYTGFIDCLGKVYITRGMRGWYSGMKANLIGGIPDKALTLASNDQLLLLLHKINGNQDLWTEILAGAGTGFVRSFIGAPMEFIKIQGQLTNNSILNTIRDHGIAGLYRGLVSTMLRDVFFAMAFFPLHSETMSIWIDQNDSIASKGSKSCLCGIFAGGFSAGITTPLDTVKTRIQAGSEKNIIEEFKLLIQNEGFLALFKGFFPRVSVMAPLFGISITIYNIQKNIVKRFGYNI